jgi:hypothetical protein
MTSVSDPDWIRIRMLNLKKNFFDIFGHQDPGSGTGSYWSIKMMELEY